MKKTKMIAMIGFAAIGVSALTGCNNAVKINFWHGFGSTVQAALTKTVEKFVGSNGEVISDASQSGYDKLHENINLSIANSAYPDMAVAYPDHMASYASSKILLPLDTLFDDSYNGDLFIDQYMKENRDLEVYGAAHALAGDPITYGVPFNKSTEVMTINEGFFEWAPTVNDKIKVPETWEELYTVGKEIKALVAEKNLVLGGVARTIAEPYEYHTYTVNNKEKNRIVNDGSDLDGKPLPSSTYKVIVDMEALTDIDEFRPFAYDSPENLFITLLNQYDVDGKGVYTQQGTMEVGGKTVPDINNGTYRFTIKENWDYAVYPALKMLARLGYENILGAPATWGSSQLYCSAQFKVGKTVASIGSSAGVYNNILTNGSIASRPVPHPETGLKKVISQGTNLTLFRKGENNARNLEAFKFLTTSTVKEVDKAEANYTYDDGTGEKNYLITGNLDFAMRTGYFPVEKVVREDKESLQYKVYQDYLNRKTLADAADKSTISSIDAAKLNSEVYLAEGSEWKYFVDPAFDGSSAIRRAVAYIPVNMLGVDFWKSVNTGDEAAVETKVAELVKEAIKTAQIPAKYQPKGVTLI